MEDIIFESGDLISAKQASEILGISRAKLSRIKNQIGFYRIGRNLKFRVENVAKYLKKVEYSPVSYEASRPVTEAKTND
jgi:excisionase family DNA binding protein